MGCARAINAPGRVSCGRTRAEPDLAGWFIEGADPSARRPQGLNLDFTASPLLVPDFDETGAANPVPLPANPLLYLEQIAAISRLLFGSTAFVPRKRKPPELAFRGFSRRRISDEGKAIRGRWRILIARPTKCSLARQF